MTGDPGLVGRGGSEKQRDRRGGCRWDAVAVSSPKHRSQSGGRQMVAAWAKGRGSRGTGGRDPKHVSDALAQHLAAQQGVVMRPPRVEEAGHSEGGKATNNSMHREWTR